VVHRRREDDGVGLPEVRPEQGRVPGVVLVRVEDREVELAEVEQLGLGAGRRGRVEGVPTRLPGVAGLAEAAADGDDRDVGSHAPGEGPPPKSGVELRRSSTLWCPASTDPVRRSVPVAHLEPGPTRRLRR